MSTDNNAIRLLIDPPLDGPANMARDEALLQHAGCGDGQPALRLYQWQPITVSLGYFQTFVEFLTQRAAIRDLPVVRRLTGGGAILHDHELTYSLTVPTRHPLARGGPLRLYEMVHDAAIDALASFGIVARRATCGDAISSRRGPFLCFERRHALDVVVGPCKLLGSAQRRTAGAILQHGSIQLAALPAAQSAQLFPADLIGPFVAALAGRTGHRFPPSSWNAHVLGTAAALMGKYAGEGWTRKR